MKSRTESRGRALLVVIAFVFSLTAGSSQAQITEIIGPTGDGVNALDGPYDVARDSAGNIYVAGSISDNVFKITPGGVITEIIDAAGDGVNALESPLYLATDSAGNVYLSGADSNNAFKITPGGVITEIIDAAGDGVSALNQAVGVATDSAGNVYVVGRLGNNVFKITPGGVITEIIDAAGDGVNSLTETFSVATDSAGNVYAVGAASNNVFKITPGGVITEIIDGAGDGVGNSLNRPIGVATDSAGNVYVGGLNSDNAFKITPGGVITEIIDATGNGVSALNETFSVATDIAGNVYVSGLNSSNAFKITPGGVITEIIDGAGDGVSALDQAQGFATDSGGNVYVGGRLSDNVFKILITAHTCGVDGAACDDGSACTTNDTCGGGTCQGGPPPNCDDGDPCTDDTCDQALGCMNDSNSCAATGACCTLPGCQVTTESLCVAFGGDYGGDGSICPSAACPVAVSLQEPACRGPQDGLLTAPSSNALAGPCEDCGGPVASDDSVYLFSGEVYQSDVDLIIPGRGLDFVWARKYRSRLGTSSSRLGSGWDFSYNIALAKSAGAVPDAVCELRFHDNQTLAWDPPTDPGGPLVDLRYCTLRSVASSNFASAATTIFVESDGLDLSSTDIGIPPVGEVYSYLISAKNANGEGPLGNDSFLAPRPGLTCGPTQGDLVLSGGDNRRDIFKPQPDGSRIASERFEVLTENADNTLELEFPDRGTWNFFPFDHSKREGKIASIVDRNGNQLGFQYDVEGRLETVTDTLNRDIQIAYDGFGFLQSVTDFAGRQVSYARYIDGDAGGSFDDLKSVTTPAVTGTPTGNDYPAGKTTTYTYSKGFTENRLNHNLLTITDPKGQTWLTNEYSADLDPMALDFDHLVRQVQGNPGDVIDYDYSAQSPAASNNYASRKTIVNDRVGNVREYYFNAGNRDVMLREFTGRADPDQPTTETANRPVDQLRFDDPPFFETRWGYNKDSQPTITVHPNSSQLSMTYDSANPNRRVAQNLQSRCALPGPLGGSQAQICESFEYATDFGSSGACEFLTRHVDGRGNEALYSHDPNGNRIQTLDRNPLIVENFEYNAAGQLTAYVAPDNGSGHRRRDEYIYHTAGPQQGYLHQKIRDSTGLALTSTTEYDLVGNVVRTIDPRGHDTLYTVNQLNQTVREISREVEPGSGIRYRTDTFYDANGNVVRVDIQNVDADGVLQTNDNFTTISEYEVLNRPVRTCREVGTHTGAIPGTVGLPTCIGLPLTEFITEEFQYDRNRNLTLVLHGEAAEGRQPTNISATVYDERDLVFQRTRAPGDADQSSIQYDYDVNRRVKRVSRGLENNPRISLYTYDGYNRLVGTADPMGNTSLLNYDANGNMVSLLTEGELTDLPGDSANVRLFETTYVYDTMNRLARTETEFFNPATQAAIGNGQAVTEIFYTLNSQRERTVDDNGHETLYLYDTMNRISTLTDGADNTRTYSYDANSNGLSVTEHDLSDLGTPFETFVTTNTYDNLDRLTSTTNNAGDTWQDSYDSRHNPTVRTDARGNTTRNDYDGADRPVLTAHDLTDTGDGTGTVISTVEMVQTWDDSSRLIGRTDDNTNTTTHGYDALDRRISTTYADGTARQQTYDVVGNLLSSTDAQGTLAVATYDLLDRISTKAITRAPGVLGTTSEVWKYDGQSRIVHAQDDDTLVTGKFDSLSGLIESTQQIGTGPTLTLAAAFDGDRNRTSVIYPSGRDVTTTFDALHRVKTITVTTTAGTQPVVTYNYFGPSRVERRDNGNGTETSFTYDTAQRVVRTKHDKVSPLTAIDDRSYGWDKVHNMTSQTDLRTGGTPIGAYVYDSLSRMTQASDSDGTTSYQFDGVGNRTQVIGGPLSGFYTLDPASPSPADFQMNQYTSMPTEPSRSYDDDGGLTLFGDRSGFTLGADGCPGLCGTDDDGNGTTDDSCEVCPRNANGQDIPFGDDACSGGHPLASLAAYDYRGQMVQFQLQQGCGMPEMYAYDAFGRRIKAGSTEFFWDNSREIEERNGAGTVTATYVYGGGLDEVIRQERDTNLNGVLDELPIYHHADVLGNVVVLTDSGGNALERYDYDDFGAPRFHDAAGASIPVSALHNPVLFNGRHWDVTSRLYYYRSRYMDPRVGKFTVRDAIGIWGDANNLGNATAYAGNNPWSRLDPAGTKVGDPIPDIDVNIGKKPDGISTAAGSSNAQGDPIPGVDVSLEQIPGGINAPGSSNAQGDPIPGVDVSLEQIPGGIIATSTTKVDGEGDPIPGVDVSLEQIPGGIIATSTTKLDGDENGFTAAGGGAGIIATNTTKLDGFTAAGGGAGIIATNTTKLDGFTAAGGGAGIIATNTTKLDGFTSAGADVNGFTSAGADVNGFTSAGADVNGIIIDDKHAGAGVVAQGGRGHEGYRHCKRVGPFMWECWGRGKRPRGRF